MKRYLIPAVILALLLLVLMLWLGQRKLAETTLAAPGETNIAGPGGGTPSPSASVPARRISHSATSRAAAPINAPAQPAGSKADAMHEILSTYNDVPIDFYGKLIDQFGNPVIRAEIRASIRVINGANLDVTPSLLAPYDYIENYQFGMLGGKLHMDLAAVTFSCTNYWDPEFQQFSIVRDTNGVAYNCNPHWATNQESSPVLFGSGTWMETEPTGFAVSAGGQPLTCALVVRGQGGGYTFYGTNPAGASSFSCYATTNLTPNLVQDINPLTLAWSYSVLGSNNWLSAGNSTNVMYVTLVEPTNLTSPYRTEAFLACARAGATTAAAAASNTWAFFPGPGNVKTWDQRPLAYYTNGVAWANNAATDEALLESGNGQCGAWSMLLGMSWAVNGISSTQATVAPTNGSSWLVVSNWAFGSPGLGAGYTPYNYRLLWNWDATLHLPTMVPSVSGDLQNTPGIPGQNSTSPAEKIFNYHYIQKLNGIYYDPSYGATYSSNTNFQAVALAGYANTLTGPPEPSLQVAPVGSTVGVGVQISP